MGIKIAFNWVLMRKKLPKKRWVGLTFLWLFMGLPTANAQQINWLKQSGSSDKETSYSCAVSGDNSLFLAGKIDGTVEEDGVVIAESKSTADYFLTKRDADGTLRWARTAGSSDSTRPTTAYDVAAAQQGEAYVVGQFKYDLIFDETNTLTEAPDQLSVNYEGFLVKYDADGKVLWSKGFVGDGDDRIEAVTCNATYVAVSGYFRERCAIGEVVLQSSYPDAGTSATPFFAVFTHDGTLVTTGVINSSSGFMREIVMDADDHLYFAAESKDSPFLTLMGNEEEMPMKQSIGGTDIYLGKVDLINETLDWFQRMGGDGSDQTYALAVDSQGSLVISGMMKGDVKFDSADGDFAEAATGGYDYFIAKYDAVGNLLWHEILGGDKSEGNMGDVVINSYGEIYSCFYSMSPQVVLNDVTYDLAGITPMLLKFQPDGTLDWIEEFVSSLSKSYLYGLALTAEEEIFFLGHFAGDLTAGEQSISSVDDSYDLFYGIVHDNTSVDVPDVPSLAQDFTVYPSPASSHLSIKTNQNHTQTALELFNTNGIRVRYAYNQQQLPVNDIPGGIYLLRITADDFVETQKVVIRH